MLGGPVLVTRPEYCDDSVVTQAVSMVTARRGAVAM